MSDASPCASPDQVSPAVLRSPARIVLLLRPEAYRCARLLPFSTLSSSLSPALDQILLLALGPKGSDLTVHLSLLPSHTPSRPSFSRPLCDPLLPLSLFSPFPCPYLLGLRSFPRCVFSDHMLHAGFQLTLSSHLSSRCPTRLPPLTSLLLLPRAAPTLPRTSSSPRPPPLRLLRAVAGPSRPSRAESPRTLLSRPATFAPTRTPAQATFRGRRLRSELETPASLAGRARLTTVGTAACPST